MNIRCDLCWPVVRMMLPTAEVGIIEFLQNV